jgi:hypothetical protein
VRRPGWTVPDGDRSWAGGELPSDRAIARDLAYSELPEDVFPITEVPA